MSDQPQDPDLDRAPEWDAFDFADTMLPEGGIVLWVDRRDTNNTQIGAKIAIRGVSDLAQLAIDFALLEHGLDTLKRQICKVHGFPMDRFDEAVLAVNDNLKFSEGTYRLKGAE